MIRLIIFDLDGVLIDSKETHFIALNRALEAYAPSFVISEAEHVAVYDGLPTSKKLQMLEAKGLDPQLSPKINLLKQQHTAEILEQEVKRDERLIGVFSKLKSQGYRIHVASNAIRYTVEAILWQKGVMKYVDYVISNEDVSHPKPNPEMYLRCMIRAGVSPRETLIVEDSYVGRRAVFESGAFLGPVNSPQDVTIERINYMIEKAGKHPAAPKWKDHNLNVLIPMAGAGSRFAQVGYMFPKPLIEVMGKPMIQLVVENINIDAHYIFVVQESHYDKYNLKYVLGSIAPGCDIIKINGVTEGAACTTLLAKQYIDNDSQLLIANSDQWVDWDSNDFMYTMQKPLTGGGVLTFHSTHPKWSYAKVDESGNITDIQEKKPISEHATVGVYYWKKGSDYVKYAEKMIAKDLRVNNEFYVAPVYNEAIADGLAVKNYPVRKMMGLGTPEDLDLFLAERRG